LREKTQKEFVKQKKLRNKYERHSRKRRQLAHSPHTRHTRDLLRNLATKKKKKKRKKREKIVFFPVFARLTVVSLAALWRWQAVVFYCVEYQTAFQKPPTAMLREYKSNGFFFF
jgi:hypothetical protein